MKFALEKTISCVILSLFIAILIMGPGVNSLRANSFVPSFDPSTSGELRLTLVGAPTTLNQLNANVNYLSGSACLSCWEIISLENSFGLPVLQNGSYNTEAGLFSSVTSNPTATVWNFTIRPGARWSDGQNITSYDVNFTFGLNSGYLMRTASDFVGFSYEIQNVAIVNNSTTEFTLDKPDSTFGPVIASQYYFTIAPMHFWEGRNFHNDTNYGHDVTSGPFYHESYTNGSTTLTLKANPYYWEGPNVSEIDITFVQNKTQSSTLLQQGSTDLAIIDPNVASSFAESSNFGLNVERDRSLLYLEYNVTLYPFDETLFRRALADSVNTSAIAQNVYSGYATPGYEADGLIPPSATLWHNTSDVQYNYNVGLASGNLTNLGFKNINGRLVYPNGTAVSLTIFTDTSNFGDLEAAQMVQSDLQALNMSVKLVSGSLAELDQNYTFPAAFHSNIRSRLVVASSSLPVFGLGYVDVQPTYENYFPWSANNIRQPNWVLPQNIEADYYNILPQAGIS